MRWFGGHPCVTAIGRSDCGPAALATVALHYGLRVSLLHLHEISKTDLQGTDLPGLDSAARTLGFETSLGRLNEDTIRRVSLPLIAHLNDSAEGHYVVVYRIKQRSIVVADPAKGVSTYSVKHFLQRWSGNVLLLRPGAHFGTRHHIESPWIDLCRLAFQERRFLIPAFGLALLASLLGYAVALFVRSLLDTIVPTTNTDLLTTLGIGLSVIVVIRVLTGAVRQYALNRVGKSLSVRLSAQFVSRLLWLPFAFFEGHSAGEILTRFQDARVVAAAITGGLLAACLDLGLLIACGVFMAASSPELTLIVVAVVPAVLMITVVMLPKARRRERENHEHLSVLSHRFVEIVHAIKTLKIHSAESEADSRLAADTLAAQESLFARATLSNATGGATQLVTGAATVWLLWRGALLVLDHRLSTGDLMFFYSVLAMFLASLDRVGTSIATLQDAIGTFDRIREIGTLRQENDGVLHRPSRVLPLRLERVGFSYRRQQSVLNDVTFILEPGDTVAILGETGSGKSTLVSLMVGLYRPTLGTVTCDGHDLADLDLSVLRRRVALVTQEAGLLSGTIRDNISLGCPEVTFDSIEEAARAAQAHNFIVRFPKGYDHEIGFGGAGLSSGQRQRITIARALVREPELLIMDEATSNLDTMTEMAVIDAIAGRLSGRTLLLVTHRLLTARRAKRIVVLHEGRICEVGTHTDLLDRNGRYAAMWKAFTVGFDAPRTIMDAQSAARTGDAITHFFGMST